MAKRPSVFTPPFRVSFPNIFRPSGFNGGEPKFGLTMLFYPAKFTDKHKLAWRALIDLADAAAVEKFKKKCKDFEANYRKPMRKGEEKEHLEGYGAGCIFAAASSKQRPGLVGKDLQPILSEDEFYAGCWARASVTAFAYDNKGKGVSFGLMNVQKLADGDAFSGRVAADEDFGAAPDADWGDEPAPSFADDDPMA